MEQKQKLLYFFFALFCIGVGLYPLAYLSSGFREQGVLDSKSQKLLMSNAYLAAFYLHISSGALALLTGWSQFLKSWRNKHLRFHRYLGYLYVTSVFISSIAGFIIALFSTGGTIGAVGFGILAVLWFITNLLAVANIKKGKVKEHEKWMIRNYGLTFSAVTLRIYLPILLMIGLDIAQGLQIVAFLCWIPNIMATEAYIQRKYVKSGIQCSTKIKVING